MRLHLEKKQRHKSKEKDDEDVFVQDEDDMELRMYEIERRLLTEKIRPKKEILRLQPEYSEVSEDHKSLENQTTEFDSTWFPSKLSNFSEYEESTGSLYSKRKKEKEEADDVSEDDESFHSASKRQQTSKLSKLVDDLSLIKNYIRTQSGGIEVASESPLSVKIENAKINRDLKAPPIESFDGSSDPSDSINLFDKRMDFFGHSEVARCRFFSTCLKGTSLNWFNNLQPRSIDSWSILNSKFRTRFSSNKKGGKITASLITVYQRSNESLRSYLTRFRAHIAEITDLVDPLAVNYLIAGIDRTRHSQLLDELFEKEPKTLQMAIKIIEHRLTLQEAVGSIQHSRSLKIRRSRSPRRSRDFEKRDPRSPRQREGPHRPRTS